MYKLDRKLIRDLKTAKGQIIAIVLVIASGIATLVMSLSAYETLAAGKQSFYRDNAFADLFAEVHRAPRAILRRIKSLPGVAVVEGRIVFNVLLKVPGLVEPATARLTSVPMNGASRLNRLHVSRGRPISDKSRDEVVVSEMFAEAHEFQIGDELEAILNGRLRKLTIVGMGSSPDHVIQIQPGTLLPDKKRYGILWIRQQELEAAFDMSAAFNHLALKTTATANLDKLKQRIDQLLEPYGCRGSYDRSEQLSHQFVTDELNQLRTMALVAPSIFLCVSAFLLHMVASRMIQQQREQIAAFKAFGYGATEVGLHYLMLIMLICITGVVVGSALGIWMVGNLTELYREFYRFPNLSVVISGSSVLLSLGLALTAGILATWSSVRKAMRLPPAEAMRPPAPPVFRAVWIEKLLPVNRFPVEIRIILRNASRRPVRFGFAVVGIALSVSVLILGTFSLDALDHLIDFQFRKAQRQDLTVSMVEPVASDVEFEIKKLRGVTDVQMVRGVPIRIIHGHHSRRIGLVGLDPKPRLYRILDKQARPVSIPNHGLMINDKLASILEAGPGTVVTVEVMDGSQKHFKTQVEEVIQEYGGLGAYMNKTRLHRLLLESPQANSVFVKVAPDQIPHVSRELARRPGVGAVSVKDASIQSFLDTIAENLLTMRAFNIAFAMVIAGGVVYNSARISFAEQSRELATMRVMGFTRGEVTTILLGEILFQTLVAIPVGFLIGYGLAAAMILGLDTENYRIPLVVSLNTFGFAGMVVLIATTLTGVVLWRRIQKLDLVEVLKSRD